jgi:hypothetical protein
MGKKSDCSHFLTNKQKIILIIFRLKFTILFIYIKKIEYFIIYNLLKLINNNNVYSSSCSNRSRI